MKHRETFHKNAGKLYMLYIAVPQEIGNNTEEVGLLFRGGCPLVVWRGTVWAR